MPVVTDFTALLGGNYWNGIEAAGQPVIVTYSFPTTAPGYDATVSGFTSSTIASFQPFTAAEQAQTTAALNEWAAASGLIFIQVAPGQGDINFQNVDLSTLSSPSSAGGEAFYPFGDWTYWSYPSFSSDLTASGDVFMNTQYRNPDGTVNYGTLLHEIGHAIGLKHPTEVVYDGAAGVTHDQVLASDDPTQTIMATVGDASGGADHLKALDQQAAAYLYGAAGTGGVYATSASGTNSTSSWSWDAATQTLTQTAASVGETIHGTSVNDIIYGSSGDDHLFGLAGNNTIYGYAGNDWLFDGPGTNVLVGGQGDDNYVVSNSATTIVENSGEGYDTVYATASYTLSANLEALQIYGAGLTAKGNDQGDSIFGDSSNASRLIGGKGADYIVGGAGADTIAGGGGADLMYGGGGNDVFVFNAASDAAPGGTLTTIGDFVSGQEKIDLSALTPAGHSLTFIGGSAFTHLAGQINTTLINGATVLQGDLNGDGVADFQIGFYNTSGPATTTLLASDLILTPQCFCAGTRILTDRGEIPVETLQRGDIVTTNDGCAAPVAWVGVQAVSRRFGDPLRVLPIRVRAGALAENIPARDLLLSPDHALYVDGVLIHAGALVNGTSITRETDMPEAFAYYHIETERHLLILAENAPAETFVDNVDRLNFVNWAEHEALYPEGKAIAEMPYPRAKSHRQVPRRIRRALDLRAETLGSLKTDAA